MNTGAAALRDDPPRYEFTADWLAPHTAFWRQFLPGLRPASVLEVGCYEGRATTFLIDECAKFGPMSVTAVDTWAGSVDLAPDRMVGVEERFDRNVALARQSSGNLVRLEKIKKPSDVALSELRVRGARFDLIYIDASHVACDVLTDAVLAWGLLNVSGMLIFDDYDWHIEPAGRQDPLNMPKPAIDAFALMFMRKIQGARVGGQFYCTKVAA